MKLDPTSKPVGIDQSAGAEPIPFDGSVGQIDFINIETTRYCNLQCRMCLQFNDGTTVTGPHMDMDLFRKISEEIFPHVTRFQPSVSGEPLMSKGFQEMLEIALRHGVRTEICTNATLLTPRFIRLLSKVSGKILISFDGATKEVFEYIREGTAFEEVVANVKKLCSEINKIPQEARPIVGLACVLMEKNIHELPQLVELAKEMGVHFLACSHVHPVTSEMRAQSLARFPELAQKKIQEALETAEQCRIPFICNPLDQVIAASVFSGEEDFAGEEVGRRPLAREDGFIDGLGYKAWGEDRIPPWPLDPPRENEEDLKGEEKERKEMARDPHPMGPVNVELPSSIWYCDFLWKKSYIALDGNVRPCCVPGTPNLGNVKETPFFDIWNSEKYRNMRHRLALKQPIPFCKGCQHIREITDPKRISEILENRPLPPKEVPFEPFSPPPEIFWEKAKDVWGYQLEASTDFFRTILFASGKERSQLLQGNCFQIPDHLWEAAPSDLVVYWRVWAHREGESWIVGQGELLKEGQKKQ
jgi:radical SAM protein with 4Fe4S-binding SPASM domain